MPSRDKSPWALASRRWNVSGGRGEVADGSEKTYANAGQRCKIGAALRDTLSGGRVAKAGQVLLQGKNTSVNVAAVQCAQCAELSHQVCSSMTMSVPGSSNDESRGRSGSMRCGPKKAPGIGVSGSFQSERDEEEEKEEDKGAFRLVS